MGKSSIMKVQQWFYGDLTTINGDFSWFNNGLTMVKNGMIMGYTLWL